MQIKAKIGRNLIPVSVTPITDSKLELKFGYNRQLIDEIKAMESAAWNPDLRVWTIKDCPRNYYALNVLEQGCIPRYDQPLRDFPFTRPEGMPQQRLMKNFAGTRNQCYIAGEMGVGKTLSVIETMELVGGYWWLIAPKTAVGTWERELRKWRSPFKLYQGDSRNKDGQYKVMTYDRLVKALSLVGADHLPDHLAFDEAHKLKNPDAQRTQAAAAIAQITRNKNKDAMNICMSGTPNPRDPTDWWAPLEIIQPGFLRESTKTKFARRLGVFESKVNQGGATYSSFVEWRADELLYLKERLNGIVLPIFKKDCLDLPEKIYDTRQLTVTQNQVDQLNFLAKMESKGPQLLQKLRQFSDGFSYDNPDLEIPTPKDEALEDIVEEREQAGKTRLVVFAGYQGSIDKLVKWFSKRGWHYIKLDGRGMDTDLLSNDPFETYQDPNFKEHLVYIANPDAGGVSITLTECDCIIFYSNSFVGSARPQAEDRCHRIGQKAALTIIDLLWLPTDRYVLNNVLDKKDLQGVTTGEITEYIGRFKNEQGAYLEVEE